MGKPHSRLGRSRKTVLGAALGTLAAAAVSAGVVAIGHTTAIAGPPGSDLGGDWNSSSTQDPPGPIT